MISLVSFTVSLQTGIQTMFSILHFFFLAACLPIFLPNHYINGLIMSYLEFLVRDSDRPLFKENGIGFIINSQLRKNWLRKRLSSGSTGPYFNASASFPASSSSGYWYNWHQKREEPT